MRHWTRSAGLLLAALSVYFGQANTVKGEAPAVAAAPVTPTTQPEQTAPQPPQIIMADSGLLTIHTNGDTDIVQLLRMIGTSAQLSIIPSKEVHGTTPAMDLYNVTAHDALDAILRSDGLGWMQKGTIIYVTTQKDLDDQAKAAKVMQTEIFHLHYTTPADALAMIKPVLGAGSSIASTPEAKGGVATNDTDAGGDDRAGNDMLVITDYPENLAEVHKVLDQLDQRPQQVLIEATIFQANLDDNNALGIDFSFLGGVDFDTLMNSGTGLAGALSSTILNSNSSSSSSSSTSGTSASTGTGAILKNGYAGATTGNFDVAAQPGGLQIGVVHNNLAVFISALESVTNATVLANPKVLTLDRQRGEVNIGEQIGYATTTTTQTATTQTIQWLTTGPTVVFRPYIGDGGFIRMEIHSEDSTGSLTSSNLPFKSTAEVTTNVMLKDGNTIVIGGLFREDSQTVSSQVPGLGSIPAAGALFRSKADTTQRQEIIILLTPHIVKDDAGYSKVSQQEKQDMEKLRVGVRKGMMWFGRERLAESAYEQAVAEMNKPVPNTQAALWQLDCATNLNPQFLEAINLKEKIMGKIVSDVDNSSIRTFLQRAVLAEPAPPQSTPAVTPVSSTR